MDTKILLPFTALSVIANSKHFFILIYYPLKSCISPTRLCFLQYVDMDYDKSLYINLNEIFHSVCNKIMPLLGGLDCTLSNTSGQVQYQVG